MKEDDIRHEVDRLRAQGRILFGPPTARQDLLARMIDPGAWTPSAQEHVDWAARHGRMDPGLSFGGQYVWRRTIAMADAARMIEALDRQARGEPEQGVLDVRTLSDDLRKAGDHDGQYRLPRTRAIMGLAMNHRLTGLPMPEVDDAADGITLTWTRRHGRVSLRFDGDREVTGSMEPPRPDFEPWTRSVHSRDLPVLFADLLRDRPDADASSGGADPKKAAIAA